MKLNVLKKTLFVFLCLVFSLSLVSCKKEEKPDYVNKRFSYYGYLDTVSSITVQYDKKIVSDEQMKFNMSKVDEILVEVEKNFSTEQTINMQVQNINKSLLMEVNDNAGKYDEEGNLVLTQVNDDFMYLIEKSNELTDILEGSYDMTIGPLSSLWNIPNQVGKEPSEIVIPTDLEIQEKLKLVDNSKVVVDKENNKVGLAMTGMQLDFGAIAKGYAADKVLAYLKTLPITICLIDLGGNIYVWGTSPVTKTSIGVRNPFWFQGSKEPYQIMSTETTNISAVTSGVYERYIEKDGKTYHHLLDPKTGYPFDNEIASVSILGEESAVCDVIATGIFGLGLEKGINKIKSLDGYSAVFITKDKHVYITGDTKFTEVNGTENFTFEYI